MYPTEIRYYPDYKKCISIPDRKHRDNSRGYRVTSFEDQRPKAVLLSGASHLIPDMARLAPAVSLDFTQSLRKLHELLTNCIFCF